MVPQPQQSKSSLMDKNNDFLDRHILPWPVRYLTFRFVILATIGLLIPLVVYANHTNLVLLMNSYLNVMSVAVSSIVLLYATISELRQKQIAELQEKRAQEDHTHVTEMHRLVLQSLQNQQLEIEELKLLMAELSGKTYNPTVNEPVADVYAMHPRGNERFEANEQQQRFQTELHHNRFVSTVRDKLVSR